MAQTIKERAAWLLGYEEGERLHKGEASHRMPQNVGTAYTAGVMAFFSAQSERDNPGAKERVHEIERENIRKERGW